MLQIETTRLYLRPLTIKDLPDYHSLIASDKNIFQTLLPEWNFNMELAEYRLNHHIRHWEKHQFGIWGILDKSNHKFIGQCGLRFLADTTELELVYAVTKAYWGQGIATEAAIASIQYGFDELNAKKIVALAVPKNIASQKVMQKIGMKYEKSAFYYNTSVVLYSINRENFPI